MSTDLTLNESLNVYNILDLLKETEVRYDSLSTINPKLIARALIEIRIAMEKLNLWKEFLEKGKLIYLTMYIKYDLLDKFDMDLYKFIKQNYALFEQCKKSKLRFDTNSIDLLQKFKNSNLNNNLFSNDIHWYFIEYKNLLYKLYF